MEWTPPVFGRVPSFTPTGDDPLPEFLDWYISHGPSVPMMPEKDGLALIGNGPGIVMFRQGGFQVQLFICEPNTRIPPHSHPNVDSFELHVGGDLYFYVDGEPSVPHEHIHDRRGPVSRWWGRGVRVRPKQSHHLHVGSSGGAFLSVQHWLNGKVPTSVDFDWDGLAMDGRHLEALSSALARQDAEAHGDDEGHIGFEPYVCGQMVS